MHNFLNSVVLLHQLGPQLYSDTTHALDIVSQCRRANSLEFDQVDSVGKLHLSDTADRPFERMSQGYATMSTIVSVLLLAN